MVVAHVWKLRALEKASEIIWRGKYFQVGQRNIQILADHCAVYDDWLGRESGWWFLLHLESSSGTCPCHLQFHLFEADDVSEGCTRRWGTDPAWSRSCHCGFGIQEMAAEDEQVEQTGESQETSDNEDDQEVEELVPQADRDIQWVTVTTRYRRSSKRLARYW